MGIKEIPGKVKRTIDDYTNPAIFWLGSNLACLYGADKALDAVSEYAGKNEGIAMLGAYTGLTAGFLLANRYVFPPMARGLRNLHRRKRIFDDERYFRVSKAIRLSAVPLCLAAYFGLGLQQTFDNFNYDGKRIVAAFARDQEIEEEEELQADETPPQILGMLPEGLDPEEVRSSNKSTMKGKFLRTYRWDTAISDAERKYGLPEGFLAGKVMLESYGNPLELNSGSDGGAGLCQFQPGTARMYGLRTYGKSMVRGRDRAHGMKLRELVRKYDYDYNALRAIDERFDVERSTDAAARFLKELYNKYGDWDKASSAYNQGRPARNASQTRHVRRTNEYKDYYLEQKTRRHARETKRS